MKTIAMRELHKSSKNLEQTETFIGHGLLV